MAFLLHRAATRIALISATALMPVHTAIAQSASEADEGAAQGTGLEQIIVTARKQEENLQNIPVAETVISAKQLDTYGVTSIEKLTNMAPQLIVGRAGAGNGASIGLRGVSVANSSISIEQSVATVIDGVYYSGGRSLNEGLFDLRQAEVLKGPQSLFYGKNTTAGVISLNTANPTSTFTGQVKASYEFNAREPALEAFIAGPISDVLGFRLAGRYSKQFGSLFQNVTIAHTDYTYDSATGAVNPHLVPAIDGDMPAEEKGIVRGTLHFENDSPFKATAKVTYNSYSSASPNNNIIISSCPATGVPSDPSAPCGRNFKLVQNAVPADIAATNAMIGRHGGDPYNDYRSISAITQFEYSGDQVDINVVPGYIHWTNRFLADFDHVNFYPLAPNALGGQQGSWTAEKSQMDAFSVEARAQTKFDGMLNFMVGGYYQKSKLDFNQDTNAPTGYENSAATDPASRYASVRKRSHTNGETLSAFGQVMIDITPELNITGGLRYTHETKKSQFDQYYTNPTIRATYPQSVIGADQTFNNWSPEATVTYKVSPHVTTYASYKTGYKSGGYSVSGLITRNTKNDDPAFLPEKAKGFEAGIKSTLFDNQLRLNLDLFTYKYTNLQVDFLDGALLQFFTLNAASMRTKGGELQFEFAPRAAEGLTLRGSIGHIDAKYLSFPFAPCLSAQTAAQGCVFGPTPLGNRSYQDLAGKTPQQAPKWTASLGVDYDIAMSGDMGLQLGVNTRYSSKYATNPFVNDAQQGQFYQPSYVMIDAAVRLKGPDSRWELALIGRNLTNKIVATTASNVPFTAASVRSAVLDPRTIALEAVFNF
ncbi:TonB-dependent receptor [Sphingobium sp. DEHP117]|uniref:TonB-dependent receptor n=1 Tax=Sphingobium sp. DEHP117 TaxID=2993436 RepID=UPI0027D68767|nr:TonB-dependent receptor [Sphingobium sp. DEHP117]MDQ4421550.1 TonB-dependent receptor [Sphingobium sp. DEHP117]